MDEEEEMSSVITSAVITATPSEPMEMDRCTESLAEITPSASPPLPTQSAMKAHVLPLVYTLASINKTNSTNTDFSATHISGNTSNNIVVNAVPQIQLTQNCRTLSGNSGVILTQLKGKPQHLVIQKPNHNIQALPVVSGNKLAGAYLTMLKPLKKISTNADCSRTAENNNNNPSVIQTAAGSKYVIAPMPKIIKNRLPVTMTTNSLQSKIAFMPLTMPTPTEDGSSKMFNIRINDAQLLTGGNNDPKTQLECSYANPDLTCNEVIDLDSPEKSEKEYELSIVEDSDSKGDVVSGYSYVNMETDNNSERREHQSTAKVVKRGISILKKSNNSLVGDKVRVNQSSINNVCTNSVTPGVTATDGDMDIEVSIATTVNTVNSAENQVKTQRPQKRRKSSFSYRRDYDEMEIDFCPVADTAVVDLENSDITLTKMETDNNCNDSNKENKNKDMEIEAVDEKIVSPEIKRNEEVDDSEVLNALKWEDGFGSLPGSNLKFVMNEFNLLEYVTTEEYDRMLKKRLKKAAKEENAVKIKQDPADDLQCLECFCYGSRSDFVNDRYCSLACQLIGNTKQAKATKTKIKIQQKKERKKAMVAAKKSNEISDQPQQLPSSGSTDEDSNNAPSNENSQDKYSYPWECSKKGFSWTKYLDHLKAKAAPVKLFKDPFPYNRNGFKLGMKMEGIDPQHPSYFCVLTVSGIAGYRLRLHFDGYPENYDFWLNADSMDIFPVGWCEKHGHTLQPPSGFTVDNFNWANYLKQTKSPPAPKHLFANRAGNVICPNGFRVGMKLEAVDRRDTSLVCVATIKDQMDNRILVHFDSWDDIYDYWVDPTSPYIHPVGWCDQNGHNLTPPNDYPNPETFSWNKYLKETKAVAAPQRAFKQRPACGFKRGMRLECVDKRVPQLIRVASVDEVRAHQLRIRFDGWPDKYSYWVDDDSDDIHPVGWCQKTGHPIEAPLTPDDVYDFLECPTIGCRGLGHTQGAKYATHSEQKYCPYADENVDVDRIKPDRLLSPDRLIEAVVPVSREPKDVKPKPKMGRPPKCPKIEPTTSSSSSSSTNPNNEKTTEPTTEAVAAAPEENKRPLKRKYTKRQKVHSIASPPPSSSPPPAPQAPSPPPLPPPPPPPASIEKEEEKKPEIKQLEEAVKQEKVEEKEELPVSKRQEMVSLLEQSKIEPAVVEMWDKHSRFLSKYVKDCDDLRHWSANQVREFVTKIPGCRVYADKFRYMDIDGDAFLSLNQLDLVTIISMRMGPAIKLYNIIVLLRKRSRMSDGFT